MPRGWLHSFSFISSILLLANLGWADEPDPYAKVIHKASEEPKKALKRMQLPANTKAEVFAAEPLLANPVAFCFDYQGRCYVAETFRLHKGVTDNRSHMNWLDDELASRTVADRLALYTKYKVYDKYTGEHDRVRMIENGKATIFADGFNKAEDGLGSGLLAWHGNVYYTCIPHLWLLKDSKGAGKADVKKALSSGYGVHVAFIGHDSHGLKMGPDGKVYFSIGDRGLHVETEGRVLSAPDCGSVLRCNPDGSGLEIVHTGLRNPQELAFNKYGDLFTGDNNADGGDQARWVYLVEGGDSGWRIGYQYLKSLGPWNSEKIWHPQHDGQPAAHLPPIINVASGPSGLTYHPGVSLLPEKYKDHFFLCDFRGSSGGSGIHAFTVEPNGATFKLVGRQNFVWSTLATDCDFGPDGGFYISDWVEGWGLSGKGRIYKVFDESRLDDPKVIETRKLLADGMNGKSANDLAALLSHDDMRVRQEAQFALAEKGAVAELAHTAGASTNQLARIHAIWGLGQLDRTNAKVTAPLLALLEDADAEVRAQAAKVLGNLRVAEAHDPLVARLKDASPRVKFFAAQSLGKVGKASATPALLDLLRANADADTYLRHAGVMALSGIADKAGLEKAANDPSTSVRLAALLAWRRQASPDVVRFLEDADPRLVTEAARAIYDTPIPEAMPKLAALAKPLSAVPSPFQEPLTRRVLAAHYRLGGKDHALALARFAAQPGSENLRLEALKYLQSWESPSGRDPIVGLWRPIEKHAGKDVAEAVRTNLSGLMTAGDKIRTEGGKLAAAHGIKEIGPALRELVLDEQRPSSVRIDSLKAIVSLKDTELEKTAQVVLKDADARLREQARRIVLARADPKDAVQTLAEVLEKGATPERQGAIALLTDLKSPAADELLERWMDRLVEKKAPIDIQLDLLEAAWKRGTASLNKKRGVFESSRPKGDPLADYREALEGGDADVGRRIFFERAKLSCVRCHKVNGQGGDVGPELAGLSKRVKRDYILESMVDPNKQIAKGFETVVLALANGQVKTGILKSEDAKEVRLVTAEGQILVIAKDQIEDRSRGPSAMPADLIKKMTKRELRDLVEYLAGL